MKSIKYLFFLVLVFSLVPTVFAHEQYSDGWHVVVANSESEKNKSWHNQNKVWAYYENGKEIRRYSVLLGAHRGWGEAPENSLASFRLAKQKGYYRVETDVRFTSDNVPVLIHDTYINDLAKNNDLSDIGEEKIYVKNLTYQELKSNYIFNVERVNHNGTPTTLSGYDNNRITTFSEMLDFIKQNKMYVSIELKVGNEAQIRSLVKMTQDKGMHNNVIWISFSSNLLKYVKDYDDDENLALLLASTCDTTHNAYCGQDDDFYIGKLKTNNNLVWFDTTNYYNVPPVWNVNLPAKYSENPPSRYQLDVIPQGKLILLSSSLSLDAGTKSTVNYSYDGDGTVKCQSSDNSKLSCSVDAANKKITITSLKNEKGDGTITVYATRGISYSATGDSKLSVSILKEEAAPSRGAKGANTTTDNSDTQETPKKGKKGDWHHNIDVNPPTGTLVAIIFSLVAIATIIASLIVMSNYREKEK